MEYFTWKKMWVSFKQSFSCQPTDEPFRRLWYASAMLLATKVPKESWLSLKDRNHIPRLEISARSLTRNGKSSCQDRSGDHGQRQSLDTMGWSRGCLLWSLIAGLLKCPPKIHRTAHLSRSKRERQHTDESIIKCWTIVTLTCCSVQLFSLEHLMLHVQLNTWEVAWIPDGEFRPNTQAYSVVLGGQQHCKIEIRLYFKKPKHGAFVVFQISAIACTERAPIFGHGWRSWSSHCSHQCCRPTHRGWGCCASW